MRFWDSSALFTLIAEEPASRACRDFRRAEPGTIVWKPSYVEVWGACCRKRREGQLDVEDLARARARLGRLAAKWFEITDLATVMKHAVRLLEAHDLRSADALQLGAALVAFNGKPKGRGFVCLDGKLATAAAAEGFTTFVPQE